MYLLFISIVMLVIGIGLFLTRFRVQAFGERAEGTLVKVVERYRKGSGSWSRFPYRMAVIELLERSGGKRRFEDGIVFFWKKVGDRVGVVYLPTKKRAIHVDNLLCIYLAPVILLAMGAVTLMLGIKVTS